MKRMMKYIVALGAILMLGTGCFFTAVPPCDSDADCVSGRFCAQGSCVPPQEIDCVDDRDCPPTTLCDRIDGFCFFP